MLYGYACISVDDPDLTSQRQALNSPLLKSLL